MTMKPTLHKHATFQYVSTINKDRAIAWHKAPLDSWSPTDWGCALAGELCNVLKKMKRADGEITSANNPDSETLLKMAAEEIGGTYAYLDLLCQRLGLDMYTCIAEAFNEVSKREGFPHRLI